MSANTPGLEISDKAMERLVSQTELSYSQLETLGLRPGKIDEQTIRKLLQLDSEDDSVSRRFIDFFDANVGRPQERAKTAETIDWSMISVLDAFIEDAVTLGGFDKTRADQLRNALKEAARKGDEPAQIRARSTAYVLLSEARQTAVRTARGYRQLVAALKRELEGREFVPNIGMVIEIRTSAKQPIISPLSFVTMECGQNPRGNSAPMLVFDQRRRDCNEFGVCRVESIAEVSKGPEYEVVFQELQKNGRTYLDGCVLHTQLLIDGVEVARQLPGKFTSHTASRLP
jgi:hypothetical protein